MFMFVELLPILIAIVTTFIAITLLRPIAVSINLTDVPGTRKLHTGSIPLIGGLSMFLGVIVSSFFITYDLEEFNYFLLASLLLVCIGVLDDIFDISILLRLFFQTLVAIIIVSGADMIIFSAGDLFGHGEIMLNGWAYFFSVIVIIASINAVNMADGIHGLAGGNSIITFVAISFLLIGNMHHPELAISLIFCSVLMVFLVHNLCLGMPKSKRIFMGDAGSMFIGAGLVWMLIGLSQGQFKVFNPVIALWIFAAPIIDMTFVIFRRLAANKSPFKPDLFHTHHLLLHLGIKQNNVLLIVLLFSLIMAVLGVLGELNKVAEWIMFYGFLTVFVIYVILCNAAIKKIKNKTKLSS